MVFVWCWCMCAVNMLSGLQALYTPPNGRLKMWEWWICARDPNAHRAKRERCPIHSYCKSEGTECLFFLFFFLIASHLMFKMLQSSLTFSLSLWFIFGIELHLCWKLDSDVTGTFAHTFRGCWFLVKTLNEQMNDYFSGAESEFHRLASCGGCWESWRHCLLVELMQ